MRFAAARLFILGAVVAGSAWGEEDILLDDSPLDVEQEPAPSSSNVDPPAYAVLPFKAPSTPAQALLAETFQTSQLETNGWLKVKSEKFNGDMQTSLREHNWIEGDQGLKMMDDSHHHARVAALRKRFSTKGGESVYASMEVQYEKKVECGGAYFKLFNSARLENDDITEFDENTNYSIMFGPDRCGYMTNKVHFIIKYPHPTREGEWVEEHLKDAPKIPTGSDSHQYGFAIHPDGTTQVYIDGKVALEGPMKEVFKTKFANDPTIPDETEIKPADWVDDVMIPDPDAQKPDDWDEDAPQTIVDEDAVMPEGWLVDEPEMIPNPDATRPEDWDDEEDGEWKAPMMKNPACYIGCGEWTRPSKPNPAYKGPWKAPMIENPAYKGEWKPRQIPNPDHYDIEDPYQAIQSFNTLGFELWTVEAGAIFDNVLVTTKEDEFNTWIEETYQYKAAVEKNNLDKKEEFEKKSRSVETGAETGAPHQDGFFSRLWTGAQILAAENKIVFLLSVGVPVATTAYVVNRVLRRGVEGVKRLKPSTSTEPETKESRTTEEASTPEAEPDTAATTEVPKKETRPVVRRRKDGDASDKEEEEETAGSTSPTQAGDGRR